MQQNRQADTGLARLPTEFVDRLTKPFAQFLRIEAASGTVLVAALFLSNSPIGTFFLNTWESRVGFQDRLVGVRPFLEGLDQRRVDNAVFSSSPWNSNESWVLGELNNPGIAALCGPLGRRAIILFNIV